MIFFVSLGVRLYVLRGIPTHLSGNSYTILSLTNVSK